MKHLLIVLSLAVISFITGCNDSSPGTSQSAEANIEGQVMDDAGPVKQATIKAVDKAGRQLTTATLQPDGHFRIKIPSNASYPVLLIAELPNDKVLEAVITSNQVVEEDITPYTDLTVKSARLLGGLTPENITRAAGAAINMRPSQGGKRSSTGFKGDLTKQYGGWH